MLFQWNTIGHDQIKRYFERFIAHGAAPSHAFLFVGPAGIGKQTLIDDLAALWLCADPGELPCGRCTSCQTRIKNMHPDLIRVSLPPEASLIPLESIQAVLESLSTTSFFKNHRRAVIIPHVSLLSPGASNALLKSLEEPPAETLFLISADHLPRVLPTIISRCTLIRLYPLPAKTIAEYLTAHSRNGARNRSWIPFAQGRIGALMPLLKDPSLWETTVTTNEQRARALTGSLTEKMILLKEKDPKILFSLVELIHDQLLCMWDLPEKMKYRFLESTFASHAPQPHRTVLGLTGLLESLMRKESGNLSLTLTNFFTHV